MAKTSRRRAASMARMASACSARTAAATSRAAAALLVTDDDWTELEDALHGLLHIEFPSPFMDLELLCPLEAWLVVDLAYVRVRDASDHTRCGLRQELARATDALIKLLLIGEALRPWADLYGAFWTRMLSSAACSDQEQRRAHDLRICDFIRFTKARGMHVALRLHGHGANAADVVGPLRRFFNATTGAKPHDNNDARHFMPVQVALRLEQCQLTKATLNSLSDVLLVTTGVGPRLCHPTILKELSLRGSALSLRHLAALRALLEDPLTRRIDCLCLDVIIPPRTLAASDTYAAALQGTLAAAVRAKPSHVADPDPGFRFSVGKCTRLTAWLFDAIRHALEQATRPLRSLSLACLPVADYAAALRLGRLVNTPLPTATCGLELDLSCTTTYRVSENGESTGHHDDVETALYHSRDEMVIEAIPRIHAAVVSAKDGIGGRVTCRLLYPEVYEQASLTRPNVAATENTDDEWDPFTTTAPLDNAAVTTFEWYDVVAVASRGLFQLVVPGLDATGTVTGWVPSAAIASLRIGGTGVVGSTCSQLILDGAKHGHTVPQSDRHVTTMLTAMGANLRRLSLQQNEGFFNGMPRYLKLCPRLIELNANNCGTAFRSYRSNWSEHVTKDTGVSLQMLHVADCRMDGASLRSLPPLAKLRFLQLADNPLQGTGLDVLLERLRASPALLYVNIRGDSIPHQQVKRAVETYTKHTCLAVGARAAFLSAVLSTTLLPLGRCLPLDVIALIFGLAGARTSPTVVW